MKKNIRDIVAASVCRFNVEIDAEVNRLAPTISEDVCEEPCDYCKLAAEYICKQIEESDDVK
jgi:hypothetical protein